MSDADEFIKTEHRRGDDGEGALSERFSDTQRLRVITHDETVCWITVSAMFCFKLNNRNVWFGSACQPFIGGILMGL